MRKADFLYFLLIFLAFGCTASKTKNNPRKSPPTENLRISDTTNFENKIVFLTIRITQTDSVRDTYIFKVIHTIVANGKLKRNLLAAFPPEPNYLYCEILDDNKKRANYTRVENPLFKVYEFNDQPGSPLEKRVFKSTQGEFNLRFQLDKNSKYLSIYKASSDYKTLKKIYNATISH